MSVRPAAPRLRRVVIGFHGAMGPPASLEAAVKFAQVLDTDLLGVFVEDASLLEWSASSLVRRITDATGVSVSTEPNRLAVDFATAAIMVRQRLTQIARSLGVNAGFRVERANAVSLNFEAAEPGDLMVVVEPADPMTRLCYPFTDVLYAIRATSAPVLYVPHGALQRRGPVVAAMQQPNDEGHQVAAEVAATIGELLISLGGSFIGPDPDAAPLSLQGLDRALAGVRERLLVLNRPALSSHEPSLLPLIAARRLVPTLVVGAGERNGSSTHVG